MHSARNWGLYAGTKILNFIIINENETRCQENSITLDETTSAGGLHLLAKPVVGQVMIDVGVEVTVVTEVLNLTLSDFCISLAADAKLSRDFQ